MHDLRGCLLATQEAQKYQYSLYAAPPEEARIHRRGEAHGKLVQNSNLLGCRMTTDITELTGAPKHANQHRLSRLIIEAPNDELRQLAVEVEQYTDQLIEALEKAQAAERRWHRVASRIHEQACESDVKIDELEAIRAAAEKLVRCKGRYHSEQNYRALAALFGVTTPDLPPLEHENVHYADAAEMEIAVLRQRIADLESRTVTVKLPQAVSAGGQGYQEKVERILTAAGIKWEAE